VRKMMAEAGYVPMERIVGGEGEKEEKVFGMGMLLRWRGG
jgi:hypothetical protein